MNLNRQALDVSRELFDAAERLRVGKHRVASARVLDCGIEAAGGLQAGKILSEVCLAGLGRVELVAGPANLSAGPFVQVTTDHPVAGCMASQYAGWEVKVGDFFAMGSGPMRAAANREAIFEDIGYAEKTEVAVGVLETRSMPTPKVVAMLADACGVLERDLVLLIAPTASQAGNVQVVARSVETAMHKLYELGFDLDRVQSGWGIAPLPPVAGDDLAAIGRSNDAILYGSEVTLWIEGDDASLEQVGPQVPSNSSADHGEPFCNIFARYDNDFYKIDEHLFSPAIINLVNLETGRSFRFGEFVPDVLQCSFYE